METTTETSYVVRFRVSGDRDAIWQRMQFKDEDRTYSEDEANKAISRLMRNGFEAVRSKYTVTREDSVC